MLARMAAEHHGTFTIVHARACGFSDATIERRLAAGDWLSCHVGVFHHPAVPRSWRGDLLAACWAGGFRAVASHRSAAALWGLKGGWRHVPEITCPRWRRARHGPLSRPPNGVAASVQPAQT